MRVWFQVRVSLKSRVSVIIRVAVTVTVAVSLWVSVRARGVQKAAALRGPSRNALYFKSLVRVGE